MRTVSWVLLLIVGLLIVLGSLGSAGVAYVAPPENDIYFGSTTLSDITTDPEVQNALRGRRGTAASFGLAFAVLWLFVVLFPYRRGEIWAWWAVLFSVFALAGLAFLRYPLLGTSLGAFTFLVLAGVVFVAVLLDLPRLSRPGR